MYQATAFGNLCQFGAIETKWVNVAHTSRDSIKPCLVRGGRLTNPTFPIQSLNIHNLSSPYLTLVIVQHCYCSFPRYCACAWQRYCFWWTRMNASRLMKFVQYPWNVEIWCRELWDPCKTKVIWRSLLQSFVSTYFKTSPSFTCLWNSRCI